MKTYLDELADVIKSQLDRSANPPPDADYLFVLYAVLLRTKGSDVTSSDVHDAWSAWMQLTNPKHDSIKPFDGLPPRIQLEDDVYAEAIRKASRIVEDSHLESR